MRMIQIPTFLSFHNFVKIMNIWICRQKIQKALRYDDRIFNYWSFVQSLRLSLKSLHTFLAGLPLSKSVKSRFYNSKTKTFMSCLNSGLGLKMELAVVPYLNRKWNWKLSTMDCHVQFFYTSKGRNFLLRNFNFYLPTCQLFILCEVFPLFGWGIYGYQIPCGGKGHQYQSVPGGHD